MTTSVHMHTPLPGPPQHGDLVHGYIRTTTHNPVQSEAAMVDIRYWCSDAGWTLGSVLVDAGIPDDGRDAPGLVALVGEAAAGRCAIAVLAHVHHLSWNLERAAAMAGRLWAYGTRIIIAGDGFELTDEYFEEVRALRADDGPDRWELCANLLASLPDARSPREAGGLA